jgi:hypothetical protein
LVHSPTLIALVLLSFDQLRQMAVLYQARDRLL